MRVQCLTAAILLLTIAGTKSELPPELSDTIREDLFKIYTGVALLERQVSRVPVTPDQVKFFLFTKKNPENYTIIDPSNPSQFDNKDATIVFIIHGWLENRGKQWYEDLKNAFLNKKREYYVVEVDWSILALQGYVLASYTTQDVGRIIGELVVNLHTNYSIPLDNFLIVGHSLGGQISGFIGKTVQRLTNQSLPRIIALDAAGPLYINRPKDERLNKNDAKVVEAIHTDGGTFGFLLPCGTVDFFPNGGSSQPGCATVDLLDPTTAIEPIMCDHQRSWKYFIEAVEKPEEFKGTKCGDWLQYKTRYLCDNELQPMGDLEMTKQGRFFLETNSEPPYSVLNKKRIKLLF